MVRLSKPEVVGGAKNLSRFLQCIFDLASSEESCCRCILEAISELAIGKSKTPAHKEAIFDICVNQPELMVVDCSGVECSDRPTAKSQPPMTLKPASFQQQSPYNCRAFRTLSIQAIPCSLIESSLASLTPVAAMCCRISCSKTYGFATWMKEGCGPVEHSGLDVGEFIISGIPACLRY
jgi:hypothetical protein